MKNCLTILVAAAAVFAASCASTRGGILISNSQEYDVNRSREEGMSTKKERPKWVKSLSGWRNENGYLKDGVQYFVGKSIKNLDSLATSDKDWTAEDSLNAARQDVRRQISEYIGSEISSYYAERIEEQSSGRGTEQNGETVAQLTRYQTEEKSLSEVESKSSAYLENFGAALEFFEEWSKQAKNGKGKITAYFTWVLCAVSKEDVEKARAKLKEDRERGITAEAKKADLKGKEEEKFTELDEKCKEKVKELKDLDEIQFSSDAKLFSDKYYELVRLCTQMDELSTLKNRTDEKGDEYRGALEKFKGELRKYNPGTRQQRLINGLQEQVAKMQATIESYDKVRSQAILLSYPNRPDDTLISAANIFASNNMVQTRDFIYFRNMNGENAIAQGERGLESPAGLLSYDEAARYCNWLSSLYGYAPCYTVDANKQVKDFDKSKNGYRLPTQSEITAILNARPVIVDEAEFTETGIWSQDGTSAAHKTYKLNAGSGAMSSRLTEQTLANSTTVINLGFRMVRNAK